MRNVRKKGRASCRIYARPLRKREKEDAGKINRRIGGRKISPKQSPNRIKGGKGKEPRRPTRISPMVVIEIDLKKITSIV